VVAAPESPRDGFSTGMPRSAGVSLSVGKSTLLPDAQARVSDCTVAYAEGAAVTACPGTRRDRGLAYAQYHHGEPCLSRGVLCGHLRPTGVADPVDDAAALPSASNPATTPRDGATSRPARWVLSPAGRWYARHPSHLARLPTAARLHRCYRDLSDRPCWREKCIMLSAGR